MADHVRALLYLCLRYPGSHLRRKHKKGKISFSYACVAPVYMYVSYAYACVASGEPGFIDCKQALCLALCLGI